MIQKWVVDFLINQVIAYITRWLDQNQPTTPAQKTAPHPIIKARKPVAPKYVNSTAPGTWNRTEGRWNT